MVPQAQELDEDKVMNQSLSELCRFVLASDNSVWKSPRVREFVDSGTKLTREEKKLLRMIIRWLITHRNPSERIDAAELLGIVGTSDDIYALKQACFDEEDMVRCAAISSVAALAKKSAFSHLINLSFDSNPIIRKWVYVAIFDSGHSKAVEWLQERLHLERDPVAKIGIFVALHDSGLDLGFHGLMELSHSKDRRTAQLAKEAIVNIRAHNVE